MKEACFPCFSIESRWQNHWPRPFPGLLGVSHLSQVGPASPNRQIYTSLQNLTLRHDLHRLSRLSLLHLKYRTGIAGCNGCCRCECCSCSWARTSVCPGWPTFVAAILQSYTHMLCGVICVRLCSCSVTWCQVHLNIHVSNL